MPELKQRLEDFGTGWRSGGDTRTVRAKKVDVRVRVAG